MVLKWSSWEPKIGPIHFPSESFRIKARERLYHQETNFASDEEQKLSMNYHLPESNSPSTRFNDNPDTNTHHHHTEL